ncbi:MAG: hypothetical protein M1825_002417 [Sarcosagium campestre]|nr:MAG: hypothetical protein M1825_002417 [Sarcosagium campestre]
MAGQERKPVSVLFVCLGNICRSPLAEGVFEHLTRKNPSIDKIDSCGTGDYHTTEQPDSRVMTELSRHGIQGYQHQARQFVPEDFLRFDYILAMDTQNIRDLERFRRGLRATKGRRGATASQPDVSGTAEGKVMLFGDFGGKPGEEVKDPYYGLKDGFQIAYEQMVRFTDGFLQEIENGTVTSQVSEAS